jgi:hypothetical protein
MVICEYLTVIHIYKEEQKAVNHNQTLTVLFTVKLRYMFRPT